MTDILLTPPATERHLTSIDHQLLGPAPARAALAKRTLDVVIAAVLLLLLLPVLLVVLAAVRLESSGPVIFRQKRVGRDGRSFCMYKIRSMRADAVHGTPVSADDPHNFAGKLSGDPRVTRVGRIIRKRSIDELPQLWNVVKGEMSLVGPRPALPQEVEVYDARARRRLQVLPGVTGPWQVSGRCHVTFAEMIDMDLAYASDRTLVRDLVILAKTPFAALAGRGAA